jgi:hypothetical protein
MDVLVGEINHQSQYQAGDPRSVVGKLMEEAGTPNNAQYKDSDTREGQAHKLEREKEDAEIKSRIQNRMVK